MLTKHTKMHSAFSVMKFKGEISSKMVLHGEGYTIFQPSFYAMQHILPTFPIMHIMNSSLSLSHQIIRPTFGTKIAKKHLRETLIQRGVVFYIDSSPP